MNDTEREKDHDAQVQALRRRIESLEQENNKLREMIRARSLRAPLPAGQLIGPTPVGSF